MRCCARLCVRWVGVVAVWLSLLASCGAVNLPPTRWQRLTCNTTKGHLDIDLALDWSPYGVQRVRDMAKAGFFKDVAFFRAVKGFVTQFGISGDPNMQAQWGAIPDDPSLGIPFFKGMMAYAGNGYNSRTTQIFFAMANQYQLGQSPWETALGFVTPATLHVIDSIYTGYGDGAPWGSGPDQGRIFNEGNSYLRANFPLLDYINECHLIDDDPCLTLDRDSKCANWATPGAFSASGECVGNAAWMRTNCPQACATCGTNHTIGSGKYQCTFENADCLPWAVPGAYSTEGECVRNPHWMARHCGRVCANCL